MSEENVEAVRKAIDAYGRGDMDAFVSVLDQGFEIRSAIVGGVEGKVYRGHAGAIGWLEDSAETFDQLQVEVGEFRDLGDRVLALGRIRAQGRESGIELDSETGWLCTVRAGKVIRAEGFLSWGRAIEAAGPPERE